MIDKEKIDDLANYIWEGTLHLSEIKNSITEWLEQNPVEPVVVGLSDEQVEVGQVWEGEGIKVKVGCLGRVSKNGEESIAFVEVDTNELKTWLLKTFLAKFERVS